MRVVGLLSSYEFASAWGWCLAALRGGGRPPLYPYLRLKHPVVMVLLSYRWIKEYPLNYPG